MAYPVKQPLNISFAEGLDQKTDDKQVRPGKFLSLVNSVFDKVGRLTKRNGFKSLTTLPDLTTSYLTTFNDDLQAIGTNILAFSDGQNQWVPKGSIYPLQLSVSSLVRNSLNQSQCDSAVASNGILCVVYSEVNGGSTSYKYSLLDSETGQNIVAPANIPVSSGVITNSPRVFLLGNNFIILFENVIAAVQYLQYVAINSITGAIVQTNTTISNSLDNSTTLAFDGAVVEGRLFIAWNGAAATGINVTALQTDFTQIATINPDPAHVATLVSVCIDSTPNIPVIYVDYYDSVTQDGYFLAVDYNLGVVHSPLQLINNEAVVNLTGVAQNLKNTIFYEVTNAYSYDSGIPSNFIRRNDVTQSGSVGTLIVSARSIGLASKAFIVDGIIYYLGAYSSPFQPTYFLMEGSNSIESEPLAIMKLAYGNGGGYLTTGLSSVTVKESTVTFPYLIKDLIQAVNKNTNVPSGTQVNGIFSQTGVNLATVVLGTEGLASAETAKDLHLSGGFLWMYDGFVPVEQNFFLYPDSIKVAVDNTAGSVSHQQYYYQVVYEWADNQGNVFRSAPSIPAGVNNTTKSSIRIDFPYLRLTYKIASPLKVVIYRWSAAQQVYYQVTSLTAPLLNSTTSDSGNFIDTNSDATILGNNVLYTTGGVEENIGPPATNILSLFDNRLWLVDAEDENLLWYSKEVIEATPVEMSDLSTLFVSPTIGSQGSTGFLKAIAPMDDKLVLFKKNAIYYINGRGPDITGANNQYSEPIFVSSTVGCSNPRSIVLTPAGLMFQSNKGIWLLGRGLNTQYIGADVESFNSSSVTSAQTVPGTNQVRFTLDTGEILMYDYFVGQWGTFEGVPALSSTVFQDRHTAVTKYGQVLQETPGTYLDGDKPVLMSFTTSWLKLEGLRGYIRAFWFYIVGKFLSPHQLQVTVAYDYNDSPVQSDLFTPPQVPQAYGDDPFYGGDGSTPFGGRSTLEQFRFFFIRQRCRAFQLSIQEVFNPTAGMIAGPGLTLSGLNVIAAYKKSYAPIPQSQQIG